MSDLAAANERAIARAIVLVERYGDALLRLSMALADDTCDDAGKVRRARLVLAGLYAEEPEEDLRREAGHGN